MDSETELVRKCYGNLNNILIGSGTESKQNGRWTVLVTPPATYYYKSYYYYYYY